MKTCNKVMLIVLVSCLLFPALTGAAEIALPRFSAQITPEVELLAGVLSQTSWIASRGPQSTGNEYYQALKEFFAPYKDHEAVQIAEELTKLSFTYDAPLGFICHLGPLPDLELEYEYSEYVVGRARGRERLERFRLALKDLAAESNFLEFFAAWQPRFDQWIAAAAMDGEMVVSWLEQFFGQTASDFHLYLAPAMFPGGGYGATVYDADGESISFQIVRERGTSTAQPEFPSGLSLEYLSLHEWGHSFVNPALEAHPETVRAMNRFFFPVKREMNRQAYNNVQVFMNEQVLRAVTTLAGEELYGAETAQRFLDSETKAHFYLTEDVVNILRDYQANRDTYPSFDLFVPVLLERIGQLRPLPWWQSINPYLLIPAIVILIRLVQLMLSRKKRSNQL